MTTIYGLKAHLVLEDDNGEFEVRDALVAHTLNGRVMVDICRVREAIDARDAGRPVH